MRGRQWGGVRGGSPPAPTRLGWTRLDAQSEVCVPVPEGDPVPGCSLRITVRAHPAARWGRGRSAGTEVEESTRSPTRRVKVAQCAHLSEEPTATLKTSRAPPPHAFPELKEHENECLSAVSPRAWGAPQRLLRELRHHDVMAGL